MWTGPAQAARQRALPSLAELPAPHRRFDHVCAPAYLGRKRGEVARTCTTVLQAHSHQWLGTFGGAGNGDYQGELARACEAIIGYAGWLCMPLSHILIRLDGMSGTTAVLTPLLLSGMGVIVRSKEYGLLDLPVVAARLKEPPDAQTTHPESGAQRCLFNCPAVAIDAAVPPVRVIVATHPTTSTAKPPIGIAREGTVYELFLTTAGKAAFTCTDVLDLYLHRGSFETILADEDGEQETDRWCSQTAWGQEFWQILSQWLWNLRLDLGQHLSPSPLQLTEFAPAAESADEARCEPVAEPVQYGPPRWAHRSFTKGFAGSDFAPQPDGSLRCPAGHPLTVQERRPERNGSLRVVYGARIGHCRPCPLRSQCQEASTTKKPRQVSAVLWPVEPCASGSPPVEPLVPLQALHPVLWGDWPRSHLRRTFIRTLQRQTVELSFHPLQPEKTLSAAPDHVQTRAQRAHYRLSWQQRLARNARSAATSSLEITLYGLPASLAE